VPGRELPQVERRVAEPATIGGAQVAAEDVAGEEAGVEEDGGTSRLKKAELIGMTTRNTIVVPCIVNKRL